MARRSKKKKIGFKEVVHLILFFIFTYSIIVFYFNGNTTKEYILLYLVAYLGVMVYFSFMVSKKLMKLYDSIIFKTLVAIILLFCLFLLCNGMINIFHISNDSMMRAVYSGYLIMLVFALLLFDFVVLETKKKRKKGTSRKKSNSKSVNKSSKRSNSKK